MDKSTFGEENKHPLVDDKRRIALYDNFVSVNSVDSSLYERYPIKRGLHNDGSGVMCGRY